MKNEVKEQQKELKKMGAGSPVPSWLIILLLKFWAAAAAVFFSVIAGLDIGFDASNFNNENVYEILWTWFVTIVMIALFTTLFANYIVRPLVRMFYSSRNDTFRFNMVNVTGIKSLFINLGYHIVLSVILFFITLFLSSRGWVLDLFGTTGGSGIEPITYGLCYILVDGIFLLGKNLIIFLYRKHKYKKQMMEGSQRV